MVNNNDETILFMQLEPLIRVYMHDLTQTKPGLTPAETLILRGQINKKLIELDNLRGYQFDVKESTQEWFSKNF
jgi:hypothetical protein